MYIFRDKYNVDFGTDNRDFICMEKGWLKLDVVLSITTPTLKLSLIIYDTAFLLIVWGPRVLWLVLFMLGNIYYFLWGTLACYCTLFSNNKDIFEDAAAPFTEHESFKIKNSNIT